VRIMKRITLLLTKSYLDCARLSASAYGHLSARSR
jgi:hypothetical protein